MNWININYMFDQPKALLILEEKDFYFPFIKEVTLTKNPDIISSTIVQFIETVRPDLKGIVLASMTDDPANRRILFGCIHPSFSKTLRSDIPKEIQLFDDTPDDIPNDIPCITVEKNDPS